MCLTHKKRGDLNACPHDTGSIKAEDVWESLIPKPYHQPPIPGETAKTQSHSVNPTQTQVTQSFNDPHECTQDPD